MSLVAGHENFAATGDPYNKRVDAAIADAEGTSIFTGEAPGNVASLTG